MSGWDRWPYNLSLTEVIDGESLAVLEAGCGERLQRALTILNYDESTGDFTDRVDSIGNRHLYEKFCLRLRSSEAGDNACKRWDKDQAVISMDAFKRTGDPFRKIHCHMGLVDMTYIIQIHNHPAALLFLGQYAPVEGRTGILDAVNGLGKAPYPAIPVTDLQKQELQRFAEDLPNLPGDARQKLEREAGFIQRLAEAAFDLKKQQQQQVFLDELRKNSIKTISDHASLQNHVEILLKMICKFLDCKYAIFFGGYKENDVVLAPIAWNGLPWDIIAAKVHFNWRKAGLPLDNFNITDLNSNEWQQRAREKGVRGECKEYLNLASLYIPITLSNNYRGILALGPFANPIPLQLEYRFLHEIAGTIGLYALTNLEVLYLQQERKRWQNTANLLTHQFKTALTQISTSVGWAREMVQSPKDELDLKSLDGYLKYAEDQTILLAKTAKETLDGHILLIQVDDLTLENYALSVLVGNCASGYLERTRQEHKELVIDPSIELLPQAEVDMPRLSIVFANLIDNAIKYSYEDTKIYIRSSVDISTGIDQAIASIEVDDIGRAIPPDEQKRIFEMGTRGRNVLSLAKIHGSGLGLWEARSIVEAHGGEIRVSSTPTHIQKREGQGYRVIFVINIPLHPKGKERR